MHADKTDEFEDLVLWVVKDKPDVPEIATKLELLTDKYKARRISKFAESLRKFLEPFST